mgnify:CR=1 FL=1
MINGPGMSFSKFFHRLITVGTNAMKVMQRDSHSIPTIELSNPKGEVSQAFCHLIRLIRLKDAKTMGSRISKAIVDMKRKANKKDNPLASNSELEERENDISINVVSDRDLKTSGNDFDDFISLQTRSLDI